METENKVNAADKKQIEWDFRELQDTLENFYETPEQLLLEAHRALTFFTEEISADVDTEEIKRHVFSINHILRGVYDAVDRYRTAEVLASI